MSLYTVVFCGTTGNTAQFLFEHRDHAERAYDALTTLERKEDEYLVEVIDDFGMKAQCNLDQKVYVAFQDMTQNFKGQAEMQLAAARANAALQQRGARDPALAIARAAPGLSM